jgi:glycosyltransferase involved in cell wall biosynthesis
MTKNTPSFKHSGPCHIALQRVKTALPAFLGFGHTSANAMCRPAAGVDRERQGSRESQGNGTAMRDVSKPSVSVVVPVYNSQSSLPLLIARLLPVLERSASDFEVILINDASHDQSWDVIQQLANTNPWVKGVCLMRNYGQHNALLCGIRAARYDLIVTLDDDLQNPPEEVPAMFARLGDDFDVVYGVPNREQHGLFRDLASQLTKLVLQKAMGAEVAKNVSAFRVFRTQLREGFANFDGPLINIDVLLTWSTTRFAALRVRHESRTLGVSNYTLGKLIVHALNMVTGFSTLPLQVASLLGFFFTLIGVAILTFVVGRYLLNGASVPGFAFLASVVAVFSGVQMFGLGVLGEYLARIHLKIMDRPSYTIRTQLPTAATTEVPAPHFLRAHDTATRHEAARHEPPLRG